MNYCFFLLLYSFVLSYINTQTVIQQINFSQPIRINIQLGQHFQSLIPNYYDFYQNVTLTRFTSNNNQQPQTNSISCQIQTKNESHLIIKHQQFHYGFSDPNSYYIGNKKVYKFSQLKKLLGILDAVIYKDKIIILFQSGYYSFYQFNQQRQNLTLKQTKRLLSNVTNYNQFNKMSYANAALNFWGDLIISQNAQHMLFVGQQKVFLFNNQKQSFQQVKGYSPKLGTGFQQAILVGNQIICASSQQGIVIYTIDFKTRTMKWKQTFKPAIGKYRSKQKNDKYNNQNDQDRVKKYSQIQNLLPTNIEYDNRTDKLIIVDDLNGIFWVNIASNKSKTVMICEQQNIMVQNCQNLQIIYQMNITIATCPFLIVINLQTRQHQIIQQIDFYPNQIQINSTQIYLFGQNQYAVYDLKTQKVQSGLTNYKIQKALIEKQLIIVMNQFSIAVAQAIPQTTSLYCITDSQKDSQFVGLNKISFNIQGYCQYLLTHQQINQLYNTKFNQSVLINSQQLVSSLITPQLKLSQNICKITQPLIINITDSSRISHLIQYIIISFLVIFIILGLGYYWFQNRRIHQQYDKILKQAQTIRIQDKVLSAYTLNPNAKNQL